MTSKEALNQLYLWAVTPEIAMETQFYCDIIEKDLEVLDILKKLFTTEYDPIKVKVDGIITPEEFEKFKEWLNEK